MRGRKRRPYQLPLLQIEPLTVRQFIDVGWDQRRRAAGAKRQRQRELQAQYRRARRGVQ